VEPQGAMTRESDTEPLLSREYPVRELQRLGRDPVEITSEGPENQAIAEAFGLEGISSLSAVFTAQPQGKFLHINGEVRARVTQICVVSLEPFDSEVREPVDVRFSDDPALYNAQDKDLPGNEAEWSDPPDPIAGETIDLGALALEHLALALDPHPRKPGVEFQPGAEQIQADGEEESPFAALKALQHVDKPE